MITDSGDGRDRGEKWGEGDMERERGRAQGGREDIITDSGDGRDKGEKCGEGDMERK